MAIKLFNESLHRTLNKIPIGVFSAAVILELTGYYSGSASLLAASFYILPVGLLFAPLAAIFGIFDWWDLPERTTAAARAFGHGWIMSAAALTFFYSWLIRYNNPAQSSFGSLSISLFGLALLIIGGKRGSQLVTDYGVSTKQERFESPPPEFTTIDGAVHQFPKKEAGPAAGLRREGKEKPLKNSNNISAARHN